MNDSNMIFLWWSRDMNFDICKFASKLPFNWVGICNLDETTETVKKPAGLWSRSNVLSIIDFAIKSDAS